MYSEKGKLGVSFSNNPVPQTVLFFLKAYRDQEDHTLLTYHTASLMSTLNSISEGVQRSEMQDEMAKQLARWGSAMMPNTASSSLEIHPMIFSGVFSQVSVHRMAILEPNFSRFSLSSLPHLFSDHVTTERTLCLWVDPCHPYFS